MELSKRSIQLKGNAHFVAGHLFQNITKQVSYVVTAKYARSLLITDDTGKAVWVSNSAFKQYWRNI